MIYGFKDFLKLPFDNIGGKIKTLALVCCWIEILINVIVGILILFGGIRIGGIAGGVSGFLLGVAVVIIGSLFSIISSYGLYAFGTLVENSDLLGSISTKLNNIDKSTKDIDKLLREKSQAEIVNTDKKPEENGDIGTLSTLTVNTQHKTAESSTPFSLHNSKHTEYGRIDMYDEDKKQPRVSGPEPSDFIHPIVVSDKSIQCPKCGHIQSKDSKMCSSCGVMFF